MTTAAARFAGEGCCESSEHNIQDQMQPKKHDDVKQRQRLKDELRDESTGSEDSSSLGSEGLSGEGVDSVLAHLRDLEQKRPKKQD